MALLATASCGETTPNSDETAPAIGAYLLQLESGPGPLTEYVGETVSTNWDPSIGLVDLGPDEVREPLLSLVMTVGDGSTADGVVPVSGAYLTTSRVKVGTAAELDGRWYEFTEGSITDVTIGTNYIEGKLTLVMERVLFFPEQEPQTIVLGGVFRAVSQ